ncbi:MAG: copper chaperone PCu(A)C [Pseudonocardiaceae bacterium]
MRVHLILTARIVACCAAALALVGCGAGQIAQTDSDVAAVNGSSGNAGDARNGIALRDVLIPHPPNQRGDYPAGSTVPVVLTIVNQAGSADELIGVSSPAASQALVVGTMLIPPGSTVTSTAVPLAAEPTSPLVAGQLYIALITTQPLHAGLNTPVTFQFRNAGKVTLSVPMAAPPASAVQAP